jgi:hypothetical protein
LWSSMGSNKWGRREVKSVSAVGRHHTSGVWSCVGRSMAPSSHFCHHLYQTHCKHCFPHRVALSFLHSGSAKLLDPATTTIVLDGASEITVCAANSGVSNVQPFRDGLCASWQPGADICFSLLFF